MKKDGNNDYTGGSDFIFDIVCIKRSENTDAQKHADIMKAIIEKPENLHYAASVLMTCILDQNVIVSSELH